MCFLTFLRSLFWKYYIWKWLKLFLLVWLNIGVYWWFALVCMPLLVITVSSQDYVWASHGNSANYSIALIVSVCVGHWHCQPWSDGDRADPWLQQACAGRGRPLYPRRSLCHQMSCQKEVSSRVASVLQGLSQAWSSDWLPEVVIDCLKQLFTAWSSYLLPEAVIYCLKQWLTAWSNYLLPEAVIDCLKQWLTAWSSDWLCGVIVYLGHDGTHCVLQLG